MGGNASKEKGTVDTGGKLCLCLLVSFGDLRRTEQEKTNTRGFASSRSGETRVFVQLIHNLWIILLLHLQSGWNQTARTF